MFPIRDENPTLRTPVITIAIIAVNVLVWVIVQGAGTTGPLHASLCELGAIPGELTRRATEDLVQLGPNLVCRLGPPHWYTLFTSMFLHGGWFHLLGNMWFLWVFGNNVEDSMGRARFVAFYLLCGLAAVGAQIVADPSSPVPMVGASGAIGGVMGAYVLLYPRVAVDMLVVLGIIITRVRVPAYLMLGYWFLLQVLGGLPQLSSSGTGGVAFWAHVGGFTAGMALCLVFRNRALVERHRHSTGFHTIGHARR